MFHNVAPSAIGPDGKTPADNYVRVKIKYPRDLFNQTLPVRLERIDGQVVVGELLA